MSDLIDRQKAIDAMEDIAQKCDIYLYCQPVENARHKLESLPTIDAVPVIRCQDCVHYKGHWYCEAWNNSPGFPAVKEDGFCNMAERRTS